MPLHACLLTILLNSNRPYSHIHIGYGFNEGAYWNIESVLPKVLNLFKFGGEITLESVPGTYLAMRVK